MGTNEENKKETDEKEKVININLGPAALISVLAVPVALLASFLISSKKRS